MNVRLLKALGVLFFLSGVYSRVYAAEASDGTPETAVSWTSQADLKSASAEQMDGLASLPLNALAKISGVLAAPAGQPVVGPAQVIIIRHGEKPDTGNDLSLRGYQRAQALVGFFKTNPAVTQYGPPAAIYAMKPKSDGHQIRPLETVTPLANSLGLQVNTDYSKTGVESLAQAILSAPAGKMVLVAWEHHTIPDIVQALGFTQAPSAWPPDAFDRAWIVNFDGGKPVSFKDIPQRLLPGDSAK